MEQTQSLACGDANEERTQSPNKDDSLTDFKSPKSEAMAQTVIGKSKVVKDKRTKKISAKGKAPASNKKKEGNVSEKTQPSIESSFFKSTDSGQKEGHTCPLCMRYFEDTYAGTAHTKSCAAKNKVSTSKLLAAVALQERQADERLAIGLPAGLVSRAKDKNSRRIRGPTLKNDLDLQLALALSKSLEENQAERELEEALLLAAEHRGDEPVAGMTDSQRRRTLKNFGFSTNKPASEAVAMKPRRKKHLGPTILQTRTQESRDRLLTERIAEILMGNEAITQIPQRESVSEFSSIKKRSAAVPTSRLLNEIHRTTKRLWDSAELSSGVTNFYVKDLVEFISSPVASDRQQEDLAMSSKTSGENKRDYERLSNECHIEADNEVPEEMLHSPNNRVTEAEKEVVEKPKSIHVTDRQYRNTLPMDWANTLNVSTMSDVVVLVENNHIWAHKLVLYVRCSDILLDCQPMDDPKFRHVKEKICWPDIDYLTALAFLEFVYSGVIVKNECVFTDNCIASSVRSLARKYRLKDLFEYMRRRKSEVDRRTEESEGRKSGLRSPIIINVVDRNREADNVTENSVNTIAVTVNSKEEPEALAPSTAQKSAIVDLTMERNSDSDVHSTENDGKICDTESIDNLSVANSHRSMSPDLFDDTSEESTEEVTINCSEATEANARVSNGDNSNLKILAQLISEDNLSPSNESHKSDTSITTASTVIDEKRSNESPEIEKKNQEYLSLSQERQETPRSRSTLTSTDTSKNNERTRRLSDKPKSNLSIFIEKVQKINAKSALDSYTEDESLGEPYVRMKRRNPFDINNESDKSILNRSHEINSDDKQRMDPKGALSALEEQLLLLNEKKKNRIVPSFADESADMNESSLMEPSDPEDSSILDNTIGSTDYENMSIYSKYKKTHKHNNSIKKYRSLLIKLTETSAAGTSDDNDKNDYSSPLNEEAIDLTQESDTEDESSPASSVVRPNRPKPNNRPLVISDSNDSFLSGERNERKEKLSNILIDDNPIISGRCERATLQDESNSITSPTISLSDNKKNLSTSPEYPDSDSRRVNEKIVSQSSTNRNTLTPSPKHSNTGSKYGSGRRKRRFDEFRAEDPSFIEDLEKNEQVSHLFSGDGSPKGTKSLVHSSLYPELDVFQVDDYIFTQSFTSPQSSPRQSPSSSKSKTNDSLRKRRTDDSKEKDTNFVNSREKDYDNEAVKSPTNSPQSTFDFDVFQDDDSNLFNQNFESPRVSPLRTLTPSPSCGTNKKDSEKNESLRVSSPILILSSPDMDTVGADACATGIEDFNKENLFLATQVNGDPFYSPENPSSPTNLEKPTTPTAGPSRQRFSPDFDKSSPRPARNSLVRWNSMPTETSNTRNGLKRNRTPTKSSRLVLSQNVTPPVNYDTMDTPELKVELEKYGIKPQKAHRARQLLTHIYNELQTQVPSTDSDGAQSSDADEPPVKKIGRNNNRTSDDSEPESVTDAVPVIPEEMEFVDTDSRDCDIDDSSKKMTIKEAFTALIKVDKELHNKLLTYEPLALELLHVMLKSRGFKCKVNDLMDFLDQECITFQIQDQPRRRKGIKIRAKKTAATGTKNPNSQKS